MELHNYSPARAWLWISIAEQPKALPHCFTPVAYRMSRALDFLLKARPEPMQAYFTFLKQAGQHLDPKTAALISVITKVHAKTPAGLRQYLPRALKAGASADEVIDALLMAMPALGFSKIVWAIDVILEMNLPEFRKYTTPNSGVDSDTWIDLGRADSFADGVTQYLKSGHRTFIVRHSAMEFHIYDARCPHKGNLIPETGIADNTLTCPFHDWKFDLDTGKCTSGKGTLARFDHKIESENLYVKISI